MATRNAVAWGCLNVFEIVFAVAPTAVARHFRVPAAQVDINCLCQYHSRWTPDSSARSLAVLLMAVKMADMEDDKFFHERVDQLLHEQVIRLLDETSRLSNETGLRY